MSVAVRTLMSVSHLRGMFLSPEGARLLEVCGAEIGVLVFLLKHKRVSQQSNSACPEQSQRIAKATNVSVPSFRVS